MHYATALKAERDRLQNRLESTEILLIGLQGYLLSDKFHIDTTVQTKDVLYRLDGIREHIHTEGATE